MSEDLQNIKYIHYSKFENKAREILSEAEKIGIYNKNEPVEIELICQKLFGLKISHDPLDKKMQEGVLGCLDFGQNAIFLDENSWYDTTRERFTITHELGHFICHKPLYEAVGNDLILLHNELDPIYEKPRKHIETQANMMGAAILMPKDVLIAKWNDFGKFTPFQEKAQYLQRFFDVSRETIEYRLDNIFNKQK